MGVIPVTEMLSRATGQQETVAPDEMVSRQMQLYISEFVTLGFATIALCLRFFSRRLTKVSLGWDDYFTICAYLCSIGWMVCIVFWLQHGLGTHIDDHAAMAGETIEHTLFVSKLLLYIAEMFYAFVLFFGKVAMLSFYWRMFRVTNLRIPIQILGGCAVLWITVRIIISIFHCVPVQRFWDIKAKGYCAINDSTFFMGTLIVHLVMDLAIMSLPVLQLRKLQLPFVKKVGVIALFMFGVLICVAALVIIAESASFDAGSHDVTWNISTIITWACAESNLVTISVCIPVLRPAVMYIVSCGTTTSRFGSSDDPSSYGKVSHPRRFSQSGGKIFKTQTSLRYGKGHKKGDDSGSTYELAHSIRNNSEGEFDKHASDGPSANQVTCRGRVLSDEFPLSSSPHGIMVRNETMITRTDT